MKQISKAALAAALLVGVGGFAFVVPANAKKEEKPKADGFKLTNEVRVAAQAAQAAIAAKDLATAETSVAAMEAASKTDDDKYVSQSYRLQLEANKITAAGNENRNETGLAAPLDALIANPRTPKEEVPRFTYMRANISFNSKQYAQAITGYQRAKELGYADPLLGLQLAKAKILGGDIPGGVADLETSAAADRAAGRPVSEAIYTYAITSLQKTGDVAATQRWTREWLHAYGTPKNWRTAIFVFGFQGAGAKRIDKRQRVDLFRLMRSANALADQSDYLEYADNAFTIGLASETQSVVNEGLKNGKIGAASQTGKQLLVDAKTQMATEGSLTAQEAKARAAKGGKLAADTGDFCLGTGNYAKAIEMYRLALEKSAAGDAASAVDSDAVNTHLGIALANSGDKVGAKAAFAAVKLAPRTEIATLWTTWIDAPPMTAAPAAASN